MSTDLIVPEHALLSPSSADRWMNCSKSIELTKDLPQSTNAAAEEGTKLHAEAEEALKKYFETGELPEISPKIETYVNLVVDTYETHSIFEDVSVHLEKKVSQKYYNGPSEFLISGTADCIIETSESLIVIDYKSGFIEVEVEKNAQLLTYGLLAQEEFGKPICKLIIVQNELVSEWEIDDLIVQHHKEKIQQAQFDLITGESVLKAGSWCQYCPLKYSCNEYAASVSPIVTHLKSPWECDEQELADLFGITEFLSGYIQSVKKEVQRRVVEEHKTLPGFKLVQGRGRRVWNCQEDEILAKLKKKGYKVGDIVTKKLKSFTQIEKLDSKAKDLVSELVDFSPGAYKVVPKSEPGEEISLLGDSFPAYEQLNI